MRRFPELHKPVFTILDNEIPPETNRRIADLSALRSSILVNTCRSMLSIVETTFSTVGYSRAIEPSILFNFGEVLAQEPHEDGPVDSDQFPTLSVLLNPLSATQGLWIAAKSHLGGDCFLRRETILGGHAIILRHDTCHAGMSASPETKLVRVHVNLVHSSDSRQLFNFSEIVMATIRVPGGHRIRFPSSGDFNHVLHFVNRENEHEGQELLFESDNEEQQPEPQPQAQNNVAQEAGQRKRNLATVALEDILQQSRQEANLVQQSINEQTARLDGINARLAEARAQVLRLEADAREAQDAVDAEIARLRPLTDRVEGFEAALEVVLRQ